MKRLIVFVMFLSLISTGIMAQSSMTDSQVADFVQKEAAKGTSQSQIVTRLMQNGVDISQIRRVRKMYDRQKQNLGLGSDEQADRTSSRLRTNNGKKTEEEAGADKKATAAMNRKRAATTSQRVQGNTTWEKEYDENDQDFIQMQNELSPLTKQKEEKDDEKKEDKGRKVFGRDIFNNKDLTFEPAMNIATPQNYVLGPGDAVSVDVYGASQKTFDCTVSPDGQIVIEGFGPIQVGGGPGGVTGVDSQDAGHFGDRGVQVGGPRVAVAQGGERPALPQPAQGVGAPAPSSARAKPGSP